MLSVVCEAFGCVPSVAERELDQHADLVFDILDLRAYAQAYHRYQDIGNLSDKAKRKLLRDENVAAVRAIEFELIREARSGGSGDSDD